MRYPDAASLPLNAAALDGRFRPAAPGAPDPGAAGLWLLFHAGGLVLDGSSGRPSPLLAAFPEGVARSGETLVIGAWDGQPVRIAEVAMEGVLPAGLRAEPLLQLMFRDAMGDDVVTLAGRAQQILAWERASAACARCGGAPERIPGTWGKRCRACGFERFPHVHPCAIVAVRRGDELLLIRKREWPPGYYSLPSGFCDFAESIEECARREVEEETGIRVADLRYAGSQSWPFPSQIMIGFTAEHAGGEIAVERGELEDAAWFGLDALPPTFSSKCIAGWLVERERARRRTGRP